MDLDIKVARDRFASMLPNRGLSILVDADRYTRTEKANISYHAPNDEEFNGKLDKILTRFGWEKESLDNSQDKVYIIYIRNK